ncbi:MAG: hypothetical protein ABH881_00900 [bacterium]
METTKKIAMACFIGGTLCCAVAFMVVPAYCWLGLLAGLAGGYISHEFREVLRAIPVALRAAKKDGSDAWNEMVADVKLWLSKPHPFICPAMFIAILLSARLVWPLAISSSDFVVLPILFLFLFLVTTTISTVMIFVFASLGARLVERCYWQPFMSANDKGEVAVAIMDLQNKGYNEKPLTYLNVLRWTGIGIALTVRFFAWTMWKEGFCLFGRTAWHLFRLIHSKKRLLCAVDGTLGGAISYFCFMSAPGMFPEKMMFVAFGGLLGAAFGVLNWEVVSKRILHVPINND